jgi:hypothetical protein
MSMSVLMFYFHLSWFVLWPGHHMDVAWSEHMSVSFWLVIKNPERKLLC